MNDRDRSQLVDNDEGLYNLWKASEMSQRRWIRENRQFIDEVIKNVTESIHPAHYLAYPKGESHGRW